METPLERMRRKERERDEEFEKDVTSGLIALGTDSAIAGAIIGGSVVGALVGDLFDGDLFD